MDETGWAHDRRVDVTIPQTAPEESITGTHPQSRSHMSCAALLKRLERPVPNPLWMAMVSQYCRTWRDCVAKAAASANDFESDRMCRNASVVHVVFVRGRFGPLLVAAATRRHGGLPAVAHAMQCRRYETTSSSQRWRGGLVGVLMCGHESASVRIAAAGARCATRGNHDRSSPS
jgi:hypothetical protein